MKNNYLLPAKFKKVGIYMSIPFALVCLWLLFVPGAWDYNLCNIPVLSVIGDGGLENSMFNIIETDPLDEIAMLGLLISIVLIALSKEKDELREWLQRQNTDYPGFTNYIVLVKTWNQNNRDNQIDVSKLDLDIAIKTLYRVWCKSNHI